MENNGLNIREIFSSERKYDAIPWSSRAEWNEVRKNVFSDEYKDWIEARKCLETWSVRFPGRKLPIGISCTIDVVDGQLALADEFLSQNSELEFEDVNELFRNNLFNKFVESFMSTVAKAWERRYKLKTTMHSVAEALNIPTIFVDHRNHLVHKTVDYLSSDTKTYLLETAREWIKVNYWEREAQEYEAEQKKIKRNAKKIARVKLKESSNTAIDSCDEKSTKLKAFIEDRVAFITTHCKGFTIEKKEQQIINGLNEELEEYASEYPEDAMRILAADMFLAPQVINRMNKAVKQYHSLKCKLKSHSIKFIFKLAASHIQTVVRINAINIFINALIEQGKNCPETASGWIRVMVNFSQKGTEERKIFTKATKMRNFSYSRQIRWKQHICTLLSLDESWANDLGLELCKRNLPNVSSDNLNLLRRLVSIRKGGRQDVTLNFPLKLKINPKMSVKKCINEIATLDDVVQRARKIPAVYEYVQELHNKVT